MSSGHHGSAKTQRPVTEIESRQNLVPLDPTSLWPRASASLVVPHHGLGRPPGHCPSAVGSAGLPQSRRTAWCDPLVPLVGQIAGAIVFDRNLGYLGGFWQFFLSNLSFWCTFGIEREVVGSRGIGPRLLYPDLESRTNSWKENGIWLLVFL